MVSAIAVTAFRRGEVWAWWALLVAEIRHIYGDGWLTPFRSILQHARERKKRDEVN